MINEVAPYRWTTFRDGTGAVAIVSLDAIPNADKNKIVEHYTGQGFMYQGSIEEVPAGGYNSWKIAARKGLEYAFSLVDTFWTVHIYKIEGRALTDTNPTVVGYTVLRAFLDKAGCKLDEAQIEKMEEFVMNSWSKPYEEFIPDFFTLTFSPYQSEEGHI